MSPSGPEVSKLDKPPVTLDRPPVMLDRPPVMKDGPGFRNSAARLLSYSIRVNPARLGVTLLVTFLASVTEGFGLVMVLPLMQLAGLDLGTPLRLGRLTGAAQRLLMQSRLPHGLWLPLVLGVFLLLVAMRSLLRRAQTMLIYTTAAEVQLTLSQSVYASVVHAEWSFLVRRRASDFTHMLTAELTRVFQAIALLLMAISSGLLALLYFLIALGLSPAMTVLVLGLGGALMYFLRGILGRVHSSGAALSTRMAEVYAATAERLLNLKSVKTYDAEDRDLELFERLCRNVTSQAAQSSRHGAAAAFWFEVGSLTALGAVLLLALGVLHLSAAATLVMLAIFSRLMPQLSSIYNQLHSFAADLPAFANILAIRQECLDHAESPIPHTAVPPMLRSSLRFDEVSFAYDGVQVVQGVSLSVAAGKITAIMGESGAGKSTLSDLASGLLLPATGRLLLDEMELTPEATRQWRRRVGYVGQDTVLFHDSIRNNLLWARADATDAQLKEALDLAAAEFVFELALGMDSTIGDRGILLSSGQRQRISLARALVRRPDLLILDEATNALDVENEQRILEAIQSLRGNLTILMVAHRLSAIRHADAIYVMEAGRIVDTGTWETLRLDSKSRDADSRDTDSRDAESRPARLRI